MGRKIIHEAEGEDGGSRKEERCDLKPRWELGENRGGWRFPSERGEMGGWGVVGEVAPERGEETLGGSREGSDTGRK